MKNLVYLIFLAVFISQLSAEPKADELKRAQEFYSRHIESAHPEPVMQETLPILIPFALPPNLSFFLNNDMISDDPDKGHADQMQNESSIAVNPLNPKILIGSAVDYRDTNSTWVYVSTDGGKTWTDKNLGRPYPKWTASNDPSVGFGADGTGYMVYGGFTNTPTATSSGENGIFLAKTTDNGLNWKAHIPIIIHTGQQTLDSSFEDKYYIWPDNSASSKYFGDLYVPWKRMSPRDSATQIIISKSTDKGETWSVPVNVSDRLTGSTEDTTFGQSWPLAVTGLNGEVYVVWNYGPKHSVGFAKSTDGAKTFSSPRLIQTYNIFGIAKEIGPNVFNHTVKGKIRAESYPSMVCDLTSGTRKGYLYLTWAADAIPNVYFSRSTNGGDTWSSPVIVHSDTTNDQFWQWLAIDITNGDLAVMYLDSRDDPKNILVATYVSYSSDGGLTWIDRRVADVSGDLRLNPFSNNSFAGDYSGCAFHNGIIYPSWVDMRNAVNNIYNSDVFTAFININSPEPPQNFKANIIADSPDKLLLNWNQVTQTTFGKNLNTANLSYVLFRDNVKLAELTGTQTNYTDTGLTHYQKYHYAIYSVVGADTSIASRDSAFAGGAKNPAAPVIISHHRSGLALDLFVQIPNVREDNITSFVNAKGINVYRDSVLLKSIDIQVSDTGKIIKITDQPSDYGFYKYSVTVTDESVPTNESIRSKDTVIYVGKAYDNGYYSDSFDEPVMNKYYETGTWNIYDIASMAGQRSLKDSPGKYPNASETWIVLFPNEYSSNTGTGSAFSLSFTHACIVASRDSAFIDYSTDFMKTWQSITYYDETMYAPWGDGVLNNDDWKDESLGINTGSKTYDTVYIRFRLKSNIIKNDLGWFIKNVKYSANTDVKEPFSSDNTEAYPVPANNYVTVKLGKISSSDIISSSFISAIGIENKAIKAINKGENQITFEMSNLADGIYYIKLRSVNGFEIVKKIVKIGN